VLVGVRPEKLRVLAPGEEPGPGTNVLGPGTVTDVAFAGVSTQYQVALPGVGTFGVFAQNAGGGSGPAVGDAVRLAWAVDFTFALDGAEDRDAGTEDPGTGPVAPAENAA
jgi:spermidine/putrescine transport system ATP-binding protein